MENKQTPTYKLIKDQTITSSAGKVMRLFHISCCTYSLIIIVVREVWVINSWNLYLDIKKLRRILFFSWIQVFWSKFSSSWKIFFLNLFNILIFHFPPHKIIRSAKSNSNIVWMCISIIMICIHNHYHIIKGQPNSFNFQPNNSHQFRKNKCKNICMKEAKASNNSAFLHMVLMHLHIKTKTCCCEKKNTKNEWMMRGLFLDWKSLPFPFKSTTMKGICSKSNRNWIFFE